MEEITKYRKQKAITVNNIEIPEISTENCIERKFWVQMKQSFCQCHFELPADTRNGLIVQYPYKAPNETLCTVSQPSGPVAGKAKQHFE